MKICATCASRWLKPGNFEVWYCRLEGGLMKLIGTKWDLAEAKGCASWRA